MMHAPPPPLPSMPEYDSLDDHLDDLEVPGGNLLHDLMLPPRTAAALDTTPLSISNGYTSEESDYSVTTPSDEQMYSDMSFLQSADTRELVEVVADYVEDNDLTALSPQQQRLFADRSAAFAAAKMIKGKTSKYRGVTQTSKSSWGAKYSAKRITNTCKTPDEAARAYDQYLKTNYPDKYAKFANFCVRCDRFVNPLGLSEFRNECTCDTTSDGGSTEVESPPPASDTDELEEQYRKAYARGLSSDSINNGVREGSNLSISSLKLSFLEDTEPLFEDMSMLPPDLQQQQPQGKPQKRDSLTMAAVESFSNEGNLDRIIKDIDRSSSSSFKKPSFSQSNSFGGGAPNSTATTSAADFSPEEWQNLSEYLMAVNDPSVLQQQQVQVSSTMMAMDPNSKYKKIHSLDFDTVDPMDHHGDVKQEFASVMDVDDLASAFMPPPPEAMMTATLPVQTHSSLAFPARVNILTPFLEKYWRNDRKNIQCFPYCPEHGDYYRVRIENLQHRCKGVCRAAIKAHVTIPTTQLISPSGLLLYSRCNSTFSRNEALSAQPFLNMTEIKNLQSLSAVGAVENFGVLPDGSGVQFEVTFYPDVWKFEFDLPKKRRHGAAGEPEIELAGSEFLYFFEIDVFYTADKTTFQRLGHAESMSFQIGNTRTLLRQRNRMTEEPGDADRVLNADAMPEKKKVKMYKGQLGPRSSTLASEDGELDPAVVYKDGGKDGMRRIDSNDSDYDELEGGDEYWEEQDDKAPSNYGRFVSPKNTKTLVGPDVATIAAMTQSGTKAARAAAQDNATVSQKQSESHSFGKLFTYSIVCIPLSLLFVPIGLVSFVVFLVLPPLAGPVVRMLDALSDMELSRANSSLIASDSRYVLNRLDSGSGKGLFRFHSNGAVWSRFFYFSLIKLIVSVVVFVPTLLFSIVGLVLFPIRPVSKALLGTATSMALVSRNYTRTSVGKPFSSVDVETPVTRGDALV